MKFLGNGTEIYLQNLTGTTLDATSYPIVSLSNEKPVIATITGVGTDIEEGAVCIVSGSNTSLDGRAFVAGATTATTVVLEGSDLSALTADALGGSLSVVPMADMLRFCLSNLTIGKEAADAIDVSTMCGQESLAGQPQPGTVSIEGFTDYGVAAYLEWLRATSDGKRRALKIVLPPQAGEPPGPGETPPGTGGGEIVMVFTPSGIEQVFAVNEGVSFSGEGVINSEPLYLV
jgi:hypothetical protein